MMMDKENNVEALREALIREVISMYHTTRLSDVPAEQHILSKPSVQKAFAALTPSQDSGGSGEEGLDRRRREVSAEQDALQGYLANYVMSTEGADYEPTDHERALIEDAMQGWLVDRERLMAGHGFAETWQERHAAAASLIDQQAKD